MEDFLPLLGKRLRALRQKKGVTQERAAELMKVTPKHMGEIERGLATPSLPLLSKLAELHGLSLSELLAVEPDETRQQLTNKINVLLTEADEAELLSIFKICIAIIK